jgi:hypothetical protein
MLFRDHRLWPIHVVDEVRSRPVTSAWDGTEHSPTGMPNSPRPNAHHEAWGDIHGPTWRAVAELRALWPDNQTQGAVVSNQVLPALLGASSCHRGDVQLGGFSRRRRRSRAKAGPRSLGRQTSSPSSISRRRASASAIAASSRKSAALAAVARAQRGGSAVIVAGVVVRTAAVVTCSADGSWQAILHPGPSRLIQAT